MNYFIRGAIEKAAKNQCLVEITYTDSKGAVSTRMVEPYEFKNDALYAFCTIKNGMRCFKTNKISRASATNVKFTPRWEILI